MWMMGYNEAHEDHINMVEAYTNNNGNRKLRPLAPRPPPPTCNRFQTTHLAVASEQNKRELNSQQMVVVSSRWNPTPEQLQTLEELYRRGTRTPSADEIQHITAQLRRFGKIEGKNVFYWFQNHKARERQKRRRQLDTNLPFFNTQINQPITQTQTKHAEVEETRNWTTPTFSEKNMLRREKTGKAEYRKTNLLEDQRWIQQQQEEDGGEEEEEEEGGGGNDQMMLIHRRRKSNPATWSQMMQCLSIPCTNNHTNLINSTTTPATTTIPVTSCVDCYQTLELFPVNSSSREQPEKCFIPTSDVSLSPRQFIEFLPLKN